jgi:hypothetical protein
MGIATVKGRGFEPTDRVGTARVGIVSEAFAARAWPGQDPIGRQLRTPVSVDTAAVTVVGVAEEAKLTTIAGANPFVLYVPLDQQPSPGEGQVVVLRSRSSGTALIAAVRSLIAEIEPRAAVARVTTMTDVVATTLAEPLRLRFFLTLFASVALLLGIVGVYSVVSYSVSRRQTEFGVRLALGAAPIQVLRQVVSRGVLPVVVGTTVGLVAAVGLARLASGFLYGVSPADPVSIGFAAAALLGSGVAAAMVPAFRASRVSPVESLRVE